MRSWVRMEAPVPCVVASRPFGVVIAPDCDTESPTPDGFLGSRPMGQQGVTGSIVDAQVGSVTHQARRCHGPEQLRTSVLWLPVVG